MSASYQETIASLSKSTLVDFIKSNFIGSRIAVAGTGAVTFDALVSHAIHFTSSLKAGFPPP